MSLVGVGMVGAGGGTPGAVSGVRVPRAPSSVRGCADSAGARVIRAVLLGPKSCGITRMDLLVFQVTATHVWKRAHVQAKLRSDSAGGAQKSDTNFPTPGPTRMWLATLQMTLLVASYSSELVT